MSATAYPLNDTAWTSCGAADDATLQIPGGVCAVIFTVGSSAPSDTVRTGLRLSTDEGDERSAAIQKAGQTIYARSVSGAVTVTVER